ncbi:baseplate J/gp47 family protein [Bacillus atrophaeus]|uniref:baseplate J/gp47 family protein n=1 Tax=Bacillus atrophaeus TaxID=1452 RepID=UPI001C102102|nr:baseplate J/gp47 family protein [Bacillus atrophaeus]MBU5262133.1 baseplate J/gp47 family protein [Bacillus atrophaeus]
MFLKRSVQEVLKDAAISISENTSITNFSPGSIARSIIEAIAPEIGSSGDTSRTSLYDFAQQVLDQGFISKATGSNLDLIGGLFNYSRRSEQVRGEDGTLKEEPISDDLYRYELTQVVPAMATANEAALRLALLTIPGVKDVVGKEYTHGSGSFSFTLIPQPGFDTQNLVSKMDEAIKEVKAYGVRPNIVLPVDVPMDITIQLIFHETASDQQKINIKYSTEAKLKDYLSGFEIGQHFIYNDLAQEIMNADNKIVDFEITQFYLNNEPVLITNHDILEDERIVPQNITVL